MVRDKKMILRFFIILVLVILLVAEIINAAGSALDKNYQEMGDDSNLSTPQLTSNFAFNLTITSDTETEYLSDTGWMPASFPWVSPYWPTVQNANYIWKSYIVTPDEALNGSEIIAFRRVFYLPLDAQRINGIIQITADDAYELLLNGRFIGGDGVLEADTFDPTYPFQSIETYQLDVRPGWNELNMRVINYRDCCGSNNPYDNPAGLVFRADIAYEALRLSLPFDHAPNENGLNRIYSFFDHEYPLLPVSIDGSEPQASDIPNTIIPFTGNREWCKGGVSCYSGHNGYDFSYNLPEGRPVLAAAAGEVTSGTDFCGSHYVKINHGRYQTIYWHLRDDTHWMRSGHVNAGERIGSVGKSGYPRCSSGAHLHFGVYYDYDDDGIFEVDELVDPYGFNPTKIDPWTLSFTDALGQQRKGVPSIWLWEFNPPDHVIATPGTEYTLFNDNVDITIPNDAIIDTASLALMLVPEPSSNMASTRSPYSITISSGYTFQLTGAYTGTGTGTAQLMNFAAPISITVAYTDSDLTYVQDSTIGLYHWDDISLHWSLLTTTLNISANQAIATTDKLGLFSLRGHPLNSAPALLDTSPSSFINTVENQILVIGTNFLPTPWLNLGITALDTHYLSSSTLTATIPSLLIPGTYTLTLRNPDGQTTSLPNAFTIKSAVYLPVIVK